MADELFQPSVQTKMPDLGSPTYDSCLYDLKVCGVSPNMKTRGGEVAVKGVAGIDPEGGTDQKTGQPKAISYGELSLSHRTNDGNGTTSKLQFSASVEGDKRDYNSSVKASYNNYQEGPDSDREVSLSVKNAQYSSSYEQRSRTTADIEISKHTDSCTDTISASYDSWAGEAQVTYTKKCDL